MPEILNAAFSRRILTCALLLGIAWPCTLAFAQQINPGASPPPPPAPPQQGAQANPMCIRLEGQLASIDRGAAGSGDPARDEQVRRYQDAAAKQQAELDRV